jgi:hypothetical protein
MSDHEIYSLVLASDYRVKDLGRMWSNVKDRRAHLAGIGAHHIVVYESIWEPNRVLVTIGIRHRRSVEEVLRSPAIFEWFDVDGVNDIPAIFAGEVVEKIDIEEPEADLIVAGVVVGTFTSVDDVAALMAKIHSELDGFRRAGIRKIWVYRAFDNEHEVLILQEVDSESSARRWIEHPAAIAEWMTGAGFGAYPDLFVGSLAHVMTLDETLGMA